MRLLHVHDFFAPGNSRYGHDLDRFLARRGHEVHVMAGVGPLGPRDGSTAEGLTFHTYPYGFGLGTVPFYLYSVTQNRNVFERAAKSFRPDLVLFNQPLCAHAVAGSPGARRMRSAYSFVSSWPAEYIAERGNGMRRAVPVAARRVLEERALRRASAILVESRFVGRELSRWHPRVDPRKVHHIPGALDPERFRPPADRAALRNRIGVSERFVVFTMRRLVPRMGIDLLIRAAAVVAREAPEAMFWIGGDGPARAPLEDLAKSLNVQSHVSFLGYVPDEKLTDFYGAADLFALPTRALEGFGLVLIEALACGTPVVATRVGAIPEVLVGIDEAGLTEPDPEALARAILRRRKEPRAVNRDAVLARYSWPGLIARVEEILEGCTKDD